MKRIFKILTLVALLFGTFLLIAYIFPEVKAAVDNAVGPEVSRWGGAIVAGIEPVYTSYISPWPAHAIFWGIIGGAFVYTVMWSWDTIRLKAKQSIDKKAGLYGTTDQPLTTVTHQENVTPTKPPEEKKETTEPKPSGE